MVEIQTAVMPQLKSVFMAYGYDNFEEANIENWINDQTCIEGCQSLVERNNSGDWQEKWHEESRFTIQPHPFDPSYNSDH